jgi:hypothetical protein
MVSLRAAVVGVETLLYRFSILWGPLDTAHAAVVQPLFQQVQPVFALRPARAPYSSDWWP